MNDRHGNGTMPHEQRPISLRLINGEQKVDYLDWWRHYFAVPKKCDQDKWGEVV